MSYPSLDQQVSDLRFDIRIRYKYFHGNMLQNRQSTELVYSSTQVLRSGVISGSDKSRRNVQRRYFGYAQRRAAPMELPESEFRRALGIELTVQTLKHGVGKCP